VLKAYPEAAREKDRDGCTPLHRICGNERASLEMLSMVLKAYPEAAREKDRDGCTPLHRICGNERASLEMLSMVLKAYPEAAREKDTDDCCTPLHNICDNKSTSLESLSVVLNAWPEAVREKDTGGYTPLHSICGNRRASLEVLSAVLNACPEAAREKCNAGRTPLHEICVLKYCGNRGASLEMLSVVLKAYPEAAREKDNNGMTPLHLICWNRSGKDNDGCANKSESLRIIQTIAYEWLKAKENRTSHSAISLISKMEDEWGTDIRDDIKELFHHLSSLFEENNQSNPSPPDIMTHFINTSWWNGVWLVVNRHPSIAKTMKLQTTLMTDFLFAAGKRLSLASMMEVIKNEPDLLEGV